MFDHISIGVSDIARSRRFYDAALKPLGYTLLSDGEESLGYGKGEVGLWILKVAKPVPADRGSGLHICFVAPNQEAVTAFHAAGTKAGGDSNGEPGLRTDYSPSYYAAFIVDPDGYRLEAHHG